MKVYSSREYEVTEPGKSVLHEKTANEVLSTSINAAFDSTGYECLFLILLECSADDEARGFCK